MEWTASVISIDDQPNNPSGILVKVMITNQDTGKTVPFETFGSDLTNEIIAKKVRDAISTLEAKDIAKPALTLGSIDLSVKAETPDEIARKAFDLSALVYQRAKQLLPADHPDVDTAQKAMLSNYKPEYIFII